MNTIFEKLWYGHLGLVDEKGDDAEEIKTLSEKEKTLEKLLLIHMNETQESLFLN